MAKFNDDEKEKLNNGDSNEKNDDYGIEDESSSELFIAFKKPKDSKSDDEDDEDSPQNKPEYKVQPKLVETEQDGIIPMQISERDESLVFGLCNECYCFACSSWCQRWT